MLLPLLRQRFGQEPERNTRQENHCAGHYETQPPGSDPAGIFMGDGDTVWEKQKGNESRDSVLKMIDD